MSLMNIEYKKNKKGENFRFLLFCWLDYQDSNLDKQNQNLLCYHYTIVQSLVLSLKSDAKIEVLLFSSK